MKDAPRDGHPWHSAADTAVVLGGLLDLSLDTSQPVIYDRPIGLRRIYVDPHTGGEHFLVHYPMGLRAARHHHSAAHTIVVLDGALLVEGAVLGPGSYCHFPPMTSMHHEPADGQDCRFVIIFHGPFDVHPEPAGRPGDGELGAAPAGRGDQ